MPRRNVRRLRTSPVFTAFIIVLAVCVGFLLASRPATRTVSASPLQSVKDKEGVIFAVTSANNLVSFNSFTPGVILSNRPISGLQPGESIAGLDFRPRTGQLFAISGAGRVYSVSTSTAVATPVSPTAAAISGSYFGFDFNPTVDRIRLVSNTGQNLRLNPDTGAVAGTDTALSYVAGDPRQGETPQIVGAAYTNNFGGSTTTTLFVIDSGNDTLARLGSVGGVPDSPNTGKLMSIGVLGINTTEIAGFDISAPGDTAFASLTASGAPTSSLYSINLASGFATAIGVIGINEVIVDIAVVTRVEQIFALTASNTLLGLNSGAPTTITSIRSITGLGGDTLVGIDFRPATGELYGVGRSGVLYTINTGTGATTRVTAAGLALSGNAFGVDFNPAVDRLRVVSDSRQNLRVNPNNGALAGTDSQLAFATGDVNASATPNVVGAAYTANFAGTPSTTLYAIDSNLDALVLQGSIGGTPVSPNTGLLTTVGGLGVNTSDQVGFDIAPQTGAAFASLTAPGAGTSQLYTVNPTTGATTLVGTIGGGEVIRDIAIPVRVEKVFAVNTNNNLISFNSLTPGTAMSQVLITGLQPGETINGLDFRPATGQLFALGSTSRLYRLNTTSGVATPVSNSVLNPLLNGTSFGFDFNPVVDRIRVVSDARQNLRLHPDLGTIAFVDTTLAYAPGDANAGALPGVTAAAYTDNTAGTPSTSLFVIDSSLDILARQGSAGGSPTSPNGGQLFTIGPLGASVEGDSGFDISDATGSAYAALNASGAGSTQFYTVNLATGATTLVGPIGGGARVRGIAIATGFNPSQQLAGGVAVVNAASFAPGPIAPDSAAAAFGNFQTQNGQAFSAGSVPLPTSLGGVKVTISGVDAGLFYVSNGQINFAVPGSLQDGLALITVTNSDGSTRTGSVNIDRVGPGIFSANGSGSGTAAAFSTFDGVTLLPVVNADGTERAIDPGTTAMPSYLILFATGIRYAPGANPSDGNGVAEAVSVTIQGVPAFVSWAGPHPTNVALDQINVRIPSSLAGAGRVQVVVSVAGQGSNTVTVTIGGTPAQVTTQAIAVGQTVNGALTADDQLLAAGDGSDRVFFFDAYSFIGVANSGIAIDLRSTSFDAAILLYRRDAVGGLDLIAAEDQLGGLGDGDLENDNALLLTVLPQSGEYVVYVTSANDDPSATGAYTLRLVGNAIQPISYGSNVNGNISTSDLQTSAGDFLDAYWFAGIAGDRVQIRMSSPSFDPLLILSFNSGDVLTADDNNGGGTSGLDALITQTLPETGIYVIVATPFEPNKVGSYSLSLTRNASATAPDTDQLTAELIPQSVRMQRWITRKITREWGSRFEQFAARRVIDRTR